MAKSDSNDAFAKEVRDRWKEAEEADKANRDEAINDLKFAAGEQWDDAVRTYRESTENHPFPLPCLTINTLPQFIGQVIGDRRANATSIKVLPREDGDKQIAEVRSELIRSIELQSRADRIYAQTFEQAVTCGVGNLRIDLDYAYEDAFDRDLFIRGIANPLAVLWDPFAADPTGRDATFCFVSDKIKRDDFKKQFPDAKESSLDATGLKEDGWAEGENVRIAEYWRIDERDRMIGLAADGKVIDLTDIPQANWPELFVGPNGPRVRKAKCKYAVMVLTNGQEELSDPFELKLHRLPIIRATGREVWIGDKRIRYGLVRFARDPQRLKNYFRSVRAELLMRAPRHNFIGEARAFEGREGDFSNVLMFNDGAQMPQEVTKNNIAALLSEEAMCDQDMKLTTGIHEASLGMPGNESSGKAILARQHEGDNATVVYHDNMNAVQQEAGEVLNALIPITYDTARTIRTVGVDDAVKLVRVNDPQSQDGLVDLAVGRYDVTISTGVRYETKRQESAAQLMELSSRSPKLQEVAGDLIIQELDLVNGDKIAERVKRAIPPEILGPDQNDDKTPEEQAADQQKVAEAEQMQAKMAELSFRKAEAETKEAEANAREAEANADKAEAEAIRMKVQGAITGAALAHAGDSADDAEDIAA